MEKLCEKIIFLNLYKLKSVMSATKIEKVITVHYKNIRKNFLASQSESKFIREETHQNLL